MDDETRRIIEDACHEADRLQAEFEREQQAKESAPAGVDYKEWLASRPKRAMPKPMQQPEQIADLSPAVQKRWDDWTDTRIKRHVTCYHKAALKGVGGAFSAFRGKEREYMRAHVADEIKKLRADLDAEAKKLREEIAGLRIDTVVGRSVLRGEINELRETGMKKKARVT